MANTSRRERLLRDIEAETSRVECLVGHLAARLALGSARGRAREADEAGRALAAAVGALTGLRGLRERLRRPPAGSEG